MWIKTAVEPGGTEAEKMWALRKSVLNAHIFSLQRRIQELEQEIDMFLI